MSTTIDRLAKRIAGALAATQEKYGTLCMYRHGRGRVLLVDIAGEPVLVLGPKELEEQAYVSVGHLPALPRLREND